MTRPILPTLLVVSSLGLLVVGALYVSTTLWPREVTDVLTYRHAAELLRAGGAGLYDLDRLPTGVWPYLYPPAFAALIAPIFLLPEGIGNLLWATVVTSSVVLSFWALQRLARPGTGRMVVLGVCLALPTAWLMVMGQVDAVVVALLALAVWADDGDRPTTAGLLIGLAAAIKVIPILAILPFVVLRRWRVATAAVLTGAALSLLPLFWIVPQVGAAEGVTRWVALHTDFVREVVFLGFGGQEAREWMLLPWNGSLPGTALRLADTPGPGTLAMWLLVSIAIWVVLRTRDAGLGVALVVAAGALGSFVFSSHNVFLFALPLALAFSFTGAGLLIAGFVLVNWVSPVLGTAAYVGVWATCAVVGATRSDDEVRSTVTPHSSRQR